jgi:hypothetical protein
VRHLLNPFGVWSLAPVRERVTDMSLTKNRLLKDLVTAAALQFELHLLIVGPLVSECTGAACVAGMQLMRLQALILYGSSDLYNCS